ncbi:MAG: hypothetical protein HC859_01375 [Bacteroidia bacterium]|nr:hypothetical protein [Bacteroidia bacterium]
MHTVVTDARVVQNFCSSARVNARLTDNGASYFTIADLENHLVRRRMEW